MNIHRATSPVYPNNLRGTFNQIRNRRDELRRHAMAATEIQRRAYLYLARNTSLPPAVRFKAQLGLNALHDAGLSKTQLRARCIETGKASGVLSKFKLCRYQFRQQALSDEIPGVHKSSW